jgi:hypothetical protein
MKRLSTILVPLIALIILNGCNSSPSTADAGTKTDTAVMKTDSATGSTAGFKLGIQMWTFKEFSFVDALKKVDSSGIKNIEAFIGQKLGGGMTGKFGFDIPKESRAKLKDLLQKYGIQMQAMGVIVPKNKEEWIKTFELAKEFGLSYITCEPIKSQWDMVDSLAGVYGIPVAIHDLTPNPICIGVRTRYWRLSRAILISVPVRMWDTGPGTV